ncbi:hypothetical protein FJZ26_03845, partial [Candidatus Parvarchaeota archaeon]|nr:hypothetical protein [Candidatus Parvarchaeota archaeon]
MEKKTNSAGLKPVAALVALLVLAAPALALAAGTGGNEGTSDLAYEKAKGAFIAYDSARQNYIQH